MPRTSNPNPTELNITLHHGNCLDILPTLPDCSIDSIVTDPPYGLEFMGKDWDAPWRAKPKPEFNKIKDGTLGGFSALPNHSRVNNVKCETCDRWKFSSSPCRCENPKFPNARLSAMASFQDWFFDIAVECLRVLKPGGHLLAFGGTRTYHRMACAIEDAGFEIRDSIHWLYGSGFPKSLDVSKAIDKAAGAEREVVGTGQGRTGKAAQPNGSSFSDDNYQWPGTFDITAPATDEARTWEGWGTALKPAHEPIVVARKPLVGTVASNVLTYGTGALNIDASRITGNAGTGNWAGKTRARGYEGGWDSTAKPNVEQNELGRWPANIVLSHLDDCGDECAPGCAIAELDVQSDGGSRFFYCAKPSRKERNLGLDHLTPKGAGEATNRKDGTAGLNSPRAGAGRTGGATNHHPTVKPLALMRYLVRLVTPPGGIVLEPFAGSGTTLMAAILEGFHAVGIEMTEEYLPIIEGRVAWARREAEVEAAAAESDQASLFDS